jgi:membrane-bound lytic murein transglycosylase D
MRGKTAHIVLVSLFALFVAGCAQSTDLSREPDNQISVTGQASAMADSTAGLLASGENAATPKPASFTTDNDRLPFVRSRPESVQPFPIVLNRTVQMYVDQYLAQPAGLEGSFRRSEPYVPEMVTLLENEGLPPDLIYLSFAESEFSSDGAGPWQLSKTTARQYGLKINKWVDERRDPIKSTRAAAEYLASLHDESGHDWRMTLVGWNTGDSALSRYLRWQDSTYDFLMKRLPRRTRSLMNRFMAVALIARHGKQYGLQTASYGDAPHYKIVPVSGGTTFEKLAAQLHSGVGVLRQLNPAILRDRTPPGPDTYPIRVPDDELEARLLSAMY